MNEYAILCGDDSHLLESRPSVLRTADIEVVTTLGLPALLIFAASHPADLIVLCHSLSRDDQRSVFSCIRERYNAAEVIVLTSGSEAEPPEMGKCLSAFEGPLALVQLSRKLLGFGDRQ